MPRAFQGKTGMECGGDAAPGSVRPWRWQPWPGLLVPARLAEHLVPVEHCLALLLHLQLPPLLSAFHSLQDGVGSGSPKRRGSGCHGACILILFLIMQLFSISIWLANQRVHQHQEGHVEQEGPHHG